MKSQNICLTAIITLLATLTSSGIWSVASSSAQPTKLSSTTVVQQETSKSGEAKEPTPSLPVAKTPEQTFEVQSGIAANALIDKILEQAKQISVDNISRKDVLAQALQVANTIESDRYKAEALSKIAFYYYQQVMYEQTSHHPEEKEKLIIPNLEMLAQALQVAKKIEDVEEKAKNLAKIATQYALYRKLEQASTILTQAVEVANNIEDANSRTKVLHQIAKESLSINYSGLPGEEWRSLVRRVTKTKEGADFQDKALAKTAKEFIYRSQLDQAFKLIPQIQDNALKGEVLAKVIDNYLKNLKREKPSPQAPDPSYKVLQIASAIQDAEDQTNILTTLASTYAKAGEKEPALQFANTIENINSRAKAQRAVAINLLKALVYRPYNNIPVNEERFENTTEYYQVLQVAKSIEVASVKAETLAEIAINLTKKRHTSSDFYNWENQYSQALQLADTIENTSVKSKTLAQISDKYVLHPIDKEQKATATALVSQILQLAQNPHNEQVLRPMLAALYVDTGQYNQALQVTNTIEKAEDQASILARIAREYRKAGKTQKANDTLEQALEVISKTKSTVKKVRVLIDISQRYFDLDNGQQAEILLQARREAQSLENSTEKNSLLFNIDSRIYALKHIGKYAAVSATSFNHELKQLVAQNKIEASLELVEKLKARGLVDIIGRVDINEKNQFTSSPDDYSAPAILSKFLPPKIEQIRQISQKHQATLVEYEIVYNSPVANKNQLRESELFIWVIKPTGEVVFRQVDLAFLKQQDTSLTQLASNPQSLVRGLGQKLMQPKSNLGIVAVVIVIVGGIISFVIWYGYSRLKRKGSPANRVKHSGASQSCQNIGSGSILLPNITARGQDARTTNLQKWDAPKHSQLETTRGRVLFHYQAKDKSWLQKPLFGWLMLFLVVAGSGGGLFWGMRQNQATLNNYLQVTDDSLPTADNSPPVIDDSLLAGLVGNTRNAIGARGRGLGIVPQEQRINPSRHLQQLHQLLIEPIADLLPKNPDERLIFIPDGSLFFVPFPALQDQAGKYLIEKHTIQTAPSIQMLELTYQQRQRIKQLPNNNVLVVGNPKMPSLTAFGRPLSAPLSPLPGAEREALAIASLLKTQAITGEDATEPIVIAQMLKARIIHLATHGLLEDGGIALTPPLPVEDLNPARFPLSVTGEGPDFGFMDGFLSFEPSEFQLSAELVVLSACDTGLGELTEEGVVGLSRSFIMAGVPSLVVSLWSVPDGATAELMTEFYRNLQRHPDKAQALRQAMLTTKKKYPDPIDWAAFTLIGEAF